jgi:phosphoribosylaminoimidazole carboxylase (NCAIR synthetase)
VLGPDSTIGILGGGQLGRMLALAAAQLGSARLGFTQGNSPPRPQDGARDAGDATT